MVYFYKKCQNLAKNERILGINEAQNEHGRSMVEMLGVLAVVGVLSVGAISGYRYAMNKYRANQTVNELNLLSHQVAIAMMSKNGLSGTLKLGEPYDTNKKLTSSGYDIAFGCGESDDETPCQNQKLFHFEVKGVSEGVCKELVQMSEHMQFIKNRPETCATGTADLNFIFELPDAIGGDGGSGSTEPEIEIPDSVDTLDCGEHGYAQYGICECHSNYSGPKCEYSDCPDNQVWDTTEEACVDCPSGTKYETNMKKCVTCLAGKGDVCGCTSNSDCGDGEYCYLKLGYRSTDEFGPAGSGYYGECRNARQDAVNVGGWVASKIGMNHQSAERFCQALGNKSLITTDDLNCSASICYGDCAAKYGYCNAEESINNSNSDSSKWAPKVKALYDALYNQLGMNVVWTGTLGASNEYAYGVYFYSNANVSGSPRDYNNSAVCK